MEMEHFFTMLSFLGICSDIGDNLCALPVVRTDSGKILGKHLKVDDRDVTAFLGIPFAEPPLGDLRFRKPIPIKKWNDILDATNKPPACIQYSSRNVSWYATSKPNEDCLYLNIWVPGKCLNDRSKSLPVLVWIHGGGFSGGSTDMDVYDGTILSSLGNTILVTMNYRVGPFGFLNSLTELAPGNMGMLDQNMAMRWIKENIGYFGGNANVITLAGDSAGSISVGLHVISPMSKGLFQRAIMQSGSPYHKILTETNATRLFKANFISKIVGCADDRHDFYNSPEMMVECLKSKDAAELARAEDLVTQKLSYFFFPSVGDEFLPVHPITAMNTANFKDVDLLIGNMKNEGTVFLNIFMPEIFSLTSEPQIDLGMATQIIKGIFRGMDNPSTQTILEFYLNNLQSNNPGKIAEALESAYGDFFFICPSVFFAEKFSNVYYYEMTHRRDITVDAKWVGSPHGLDIPFVFGIPMVDSKNYTDRERRMSRTIMDKWISFVKYGNPVYLRATERWPTFNTYSRLTRELNANINDVKRHSKMEACEIWKPYYNVP